MLEELPKVGDPVVSKGTLGWSPHFVKDGCCHSFIENRHTETKVVKMEAVTAPAPSGQCVGDGETCSYGRRISPVLDRVNQERIQLGGWSPHLTCT